MHQHQEVIEQVPPDYYQEGVRRNILQRIWHSAKLREVLRAFSHHPSPKKILDVGSASGWFLSKISLQHPDATYYGIDIYQEAIEYGKKAYPHIEFSVASAEKIPYKANCFDIVICTEVLEHVENPQMVLQEIKRVLKKGGIAIIELDSGSILFSLVWYLWRKAHGKVWNDSHLHSYTVEKLEKSIRQAGFTILHKKKFNLAMAMIFTIRK